MSTIRVYSSQPVGLKLACVFQSLALNGLRVQERSLAEMPPPEVPPRRPSALQALQVQLEDVTLRLAAIGEELNDHENGKCRLDAGYEQGLRAERDGLQSRQRGLRASVAAQKGGQDNG